MLQRHFARLARHTLALVIMSTSAAALDYGDIPIGRIPAAGWQETQFQNISGWVTLDVSTQGLPPNDPAIDASDRLRTILASNTGTPLKLVFPAGTYTFKTTLQIGRGEIWLQGAGADATVFRLDAPSAQPLEISFRGADIGAPVALAADASRGNQSVTLVDASSVAVGDHLRVYRSNFVVDGQNAVAGQLVRVTGKSGNTVSFDLALGISFTVAHGSVVQRWAPVETVRLSDLGFVRVRDNADFSANLRINRAYNILLEDLRSDRCANTHFGINHSRRVRATRVVADAAFDYGGGGHGYGFTINDSSTEITVVNCTLSDLRHQFVIEKGANHCVIAYNDVIFNSANTNFHRIALHGKFAHNNLIEGNFSERDLVADTAHGANGPYNAFYRNSGFEIGNESSETAYIMIVGNEASSTLRQVGPNRFVGANIVKGSFVAGSLSTNSSLPPSLFRESAPAYVDHWPLYGPGAGSGTPPPSSNARREAEVLVFSTSGASANVTNDSAASGGATVNIDTTATGQWIEFTVPNLAPGPYWVSLRHRHFLNGGRAQFALDGTALGAPLEFYLPTPPAWTTTNLGRRVFSTAGNRLARLTVTGKDAASTGFKMSADTLVFVAPTEAESLARSSSGGPDSFVATDASASAGSYVAFAPPGPGAWLEVVLPNVPADTYSVRLVHARNLNAGIAQVTVDGTALGTPIDFYDPASPLWTSTVLGVRTFTSTGDRTLRLTVTGKNASSTGHKVTLDAIVLTPQ